MVKLYNINKIPKKDWINYSCRCAWANAVSLLKVFPDIEFMLYKNVWDKEGGYPAHSYEYTQYSIRPVPPGYGCDGTTDREHHTRAKEMLGLLGLSYESLYQLAYPKNKHSPLIPASEGSYVKDKPNENGLQNMLYDLYQLNNRSLVEVICKELDKRNIKYGDCSERAYKIPDISVPSIGLPVKVYYRRKKGESGFSLELSNGSSILPLVRVEKGFNRLFVYGIWVKDPLIIEELDKQKTVRGVKSMLERFAKEGRLGDKVKEFIETI